MSVDSDTFAYILDLLGAGVIVLIVGLAWLGWKAHHIHKELKK